MDTFTAGIGYATVIVDHDPPCELTAERWWSCRPDVACGQPAVSQAVALMARMCHSALLYATWQRAPSVVAVPVTCGRFPPLLERNNG